MAGPEQNFSRGLDAAMNILYISHRMPYPPHKGEKIRAFHQIRHLAKQNRIHVICLADDLADFEYAKILGKWCASVTTVYRSRSVALLLAARAIVNRKPLSVAAFQHKKLAKQITQRLGTERFDVVVVTSSAMAQYILSVPVVARVIDFIDVDSEKWRLYAERRSFPLSCIYQLEANRLIGYEAELTEVLDHSILISEEEARAIRSRVSARPISVISNGVDLDYFKRVECSSIEQTRPAIVFTGAMDYFPNVDAVQYFCREILPLVQSVVPDVQFYIVGRNPTRRVRRLGKAAVIVTGSVPDVRPYLSQARVAVAPFRVARGVQNKVLEAMAMGVPVVGTHEAFKGIAACERDGVRVANDPILFAKHVTTFLRGDSEFLRRTARQARSYVERSHRWQDQGAKLERLLEEVVREKAEANTITVESAVSA